MKKTLGVLLMMVMIIMGTVMLPPVVTVNAANKNIVEIKDAVKSVDIVFGGGELYVETWGKEGFGFRIERGKNSNGYDYRYYVKNKVLYVEGSQKAGHSMKRGDNKVYLYIPSDMKLDDFILVNGNADVYAANINCEKLRIDAAIGTINIVDFTGVDVSVLMGTGTINIDGKITGNVDALCSAGTLNVQLSGEVNDFDYLINTFFGEIKIGNTTYGMMSEKKMINNTSSRLNLECVTGQINFEFNDN